MTRSITVKCDVTGILTQHVTETNQYGYTYLVSDQESQYHSCSSCIKKAGIKFKELKRQINEETKST